MTHGMRFSPPYGDGINDVIALANAGLLSPPYGDGIEIMVYLSGYMELSPPYEDAILNISQNTAKLKSRMARKYSLY